MSNTQQKECIVQGDGGFLQVHSIFATIQGEGPFAGYPAIFIRLAGCNLQCPGCDTDYTSKRHTMTVEDVIAEVYSVSQGKNIDLVVITGGEPFRQVLRPLAEVLLDENWIVQIETNGTLWQPLPYEDLTIVCSPKTGSINRQLASHISALKYVVDANSVGSDGYPDKALGHGESQLARPPEDFEGLVYFQPYDSGLGDADKHQEAALACCFKVGGIYCHQIHKAIGAE